MLRYNNICLQVYLLFAFSNVLFWYGFTDKYEEGLNEEKNLSRGNSTSGSEISCVDSGRKKIQDCHTALPKEQDINVGELEKALSWSLAPKLGPRIPVPSADSLDVEVTQILMLFSNTMPRMCLYNMPAILRMESNREIKKMRKGEGKPWKMLLVKLHWKCQNDRHV